MAKVIARASGLPGAAQGASSTAEFQFVDNQSTPVRAQVKVKHASLEKRIFRVRAFGTVTGGTTTNFTVKLDYGVSATIGSNTTIADSGAIAVNSESGNWKIEAELYLDSVSGKLQGRFNGWINGTEKADTVNTEIASLTELTEELGFTVTGTFSASNAGSGAKCEGFEIVV